MEVTHIFAVLDGNDFAQLAAVHDFLELAEEIGIAQHMAHNDLPAQFLRLLADQHALLGVGRNGLFQQNIIATVQRSHGMAEMVLIHGRKDHSIAHLSSGKEVLHAGKTVIIGNSELFCSNGPSSFMRLHNSNNFCILFAECIFCINHATLSCSD